MDHTAIHNISDCSESRFRSIAVQWKSMFIIFYVVK